MSQRTISPYFFIAGISIFVLSLFIPATWFGPLKPVGCSTLFVCPIIGLIGAVIAFRDGRMLWSLMNALMIVSFPLVMFFGYVLFGV